MAEASNGKAGKRTGDGAGTMQAEIGQGPNLPLAAGVIFALLVLRRSQLRGRHPKTAILDLRKGRLRRG